MPHLSSVPHDRPFATLDAVRGALGADDPWCSLSGDRFAWRTHLGTLHVRQDDRRLVEGRMTSFFTCRVDVVRGAPHRSHRVRPLVDIASAVSGVAEAVVVRGVLKLAFRASTYLPDPDGGEVAGAIARRCAVTLLAAHRLRKMRFARRMAVQPVAVASVLPASAPGADGPAPGQRADLSWVLRGEGRWTDLDAAARHLMARDCAITPRTGPRCLEAIVSTRRALAVWRLTTGLDHPIAGPGAVSHLSFVPVRRWRELAGRALIHADRAAWLMSVHDRNLGDPYVGGGAWRIRRVAQDLHAIGHVAFHPRGTFTPAFATLLADEALARVEYATTVLHDSSGPATSRSRSGS